MATWDPPDSGRGAWGSDRLDTILDALASENRRMVVHYFKRFDDDVATVDDLVEHAIRTSDSPEDGEQLAVLFHHSTLPKLADAGIIEYDPRSRTVRYRGDPAVEQLVGPDVPWSAAWSNK